MLPIKAHGGLTSSSKKVILCTCVNFCGSSLILLSIKVVVYYPRQTIRPDVLTFTTYAAYLCFPCYCTSIRRTCNDTSGMPEKYGVSRCLPKGGGMQNSYTNMGYVCYVLLLQDINLQRTCVYPVVLRDITFNTYDWRVWCSIFSEKRMPA